MHLFTGDRRPSRAQNFDGYHYPAKSVAAYDMSDSAPSPLEPPWDDWPFSDDEDTNSLFDEPVELRQVSGTETAVSTSALPAEVDDSTTSPAAIATSDTPPPVVLNDDDDADSLFDEPVPARRTTPAIPGLHFDPLLLIPVNAATKLLSELNAQYFSDGTSRNQVMLFTRPGDALPAPLGSLLERTAALLAPPVLSQETHDLLFAPRADGSARQAIINHYAPGEGITPHVDLLGRYGDGIVGVSLGSGCTMAFAPAADGVDGLREEVYLPERSMIAMEGEARYNWTHGIPARTCDVVENDDTSEDSTSTLERGTRVSVTFRWLLPGAHVVGPS
ncbi:hypothetical protein AURDEDRAFT_117396 [Auricularia subglabra TFB-10046 SS5]|nr:hypothetical protein AURDEDRAFT_117396 [Auricularia subglabra TFB-10046 SS5]